MTLLQDLVNDINASHAFQIFENLDAQRAVGLTMASAGC